MVFVCLLVFAEEIIQQLKDLVFVKVYKSQALWQALIVSSLAL